MCTLRALAHPILSGICLIATLAIGAVITPRAHAEPIVVAFSDDAASPLASTPARARLAHAGYLVRERMSDRLPAPATRAAVPGRGPGAALPPLFELAPGRIFLIDAPDGVPPDSACATLARTFPVAWAEPLRTRSATWLAPPAASAQAQGGHPHARGDLHAEGADPLLDDTRQWGLDNAGHEGVYGGVSGADIAARAAWRLATGDDALLLAVVDTGIDPAHPDLEDGGGRVAKAIDIAGAGTTLDSLGHGTLVAGVMAARTGDRAHFDSLGMAGVCGGDGSTNRGCTILPLRITRGRQSTASSWDIATAIVAATRAGARVVNLSFAGGGHSRLERLALTYALTHGSVVVAASGNRGYAEGTRPMYPAAYAADGLCVAVGASDPSDQRALFSSYGPGLDILAPGVDVWSTWPTYALPGVSYPGYVAGSGTSFAAPFVSGTIGLMLARRAELLDRDLQMLLRASADDVGAAGPDAETGHGRLNASRALGALADSIAIWHEEVAGATMRHAGFDTLRVAEDGPGAYARALDGQVAERIEVSATVTLPDSLAGFEEGARAWPRVGGTSTVRAGSGPGYFTPWAEVREARGRAFTLRGYVHRIDRDGEDPLWVPLALDQARFGFSVIAPRRTPPRVSAAPGPRPRLRVQPNPFRRATVIATPAAGRIRIVDPLGRTVRVIDAAGGRPAIWDGTDAGGRPAPAGLYLAVFEGAGTRAHARIARLR